MIDLGIMVCLSPKSNIMGVLSGVYKWLGSSPISMRARICSHHSYQLPTSGKALLRSRLLTNTKNPEIPLNVKNADGDWV